MNIYDFKKIEKCFVCGNIDRNMDKFIQDITSNLTHYKQTEHPKEIERQERLRNRQNNHHPFADMPMVGEAPRPLRRVRAFTDALDSSFKKMKKVSNDTYNNSVVIVSGNCGIGTKSMDYYNEVFGKLNKILSQNNCIILFIRGNNDDPSIFNECKIDLSNIKTIPDYSVVLLKYFNCLCIGGSTSIDKEWKLSQEKQFGKKLFWEGECPFFDEKTLDEILAKYQIGCVITSTSPSFTFPGTNAYNKSKWLKEDSSIKSALSKERKTLDKIYEKIVDGDKKPYVWLYGRFKQHNHSKVNDILFNSLSAFSVENVNNLIESYFGLDVSKKLGGNVFTFDTFICDNEPNVPMNGHMHEADDVEELAEEEENVEEGNNNPQETINYQDAAYDYGAFTASQLERINQQVAQEAVIPVQAVQGTTNQVQMTMRWEPANIQWETLNLGETTHG